MKKMHVFINTSTITLDNADINKISVIVLPIDYVKQYAKQNNIDIVDWTKNENYTCNDIMNLFQDVIENAIDYEIETLNF